MISCNKDSTSHQAAPNQAVLTSGITIARDLNGFAKETDSLVYDQNGILSGIIQFYDDSAQYTGEDYDTFYYLFSKSGDPSSPSGINARSYADLDQVDHLLYYDGDTRIARDTNTEGYINHYGYGADYIASDSYNPNLGYGPGENYSTDTFYLLAGNIVKRSEGVFNPPSPTGVAGYMATYISYSSYPNPFYMPAVSKKLGVFLNSFFFQNMMTDFVSPNMRSQWSIAHGNPVDFTWSLDSAGRIVSGKGVYGQGSFTYSFRYKD